MRGSAPYEVVSLLGAGGMGEVYKARDTRLNRTVAIKVLPFRAVKDAVDEGCLLREARTASALNHPHIVTIHDIFSEGGHDSIVMEYVEGRTLQAAIGRKGLPVAQVYEYGIQIADALAATHAAGIVHRDLKPGNVMLTDAGAVKVLDFGLAKMQRVGPEGGTMRARMAIACEDLGRRASIVSFSFSSGIQLSGLVGRPMVIPSMVNPPHYSTDFRLRTRSPRLLFHSTSHGPRRT